MLRLLAVVVLSGWCVAAGAQAAASGEVPRHLSIARELAGNIKAEDNHYKLGGRFVSFPGDRAGAKYAMQADCSGFLLALFERADYPTRSQMGFLGHAAGRKRPASEDFVHSIERGMGFERIRKVEDVRPGDLLAHAMLDKQDQKQTGTTGHVFLIDSVPRPVAAKRPVVAGTRQFEVSIIDSSLEQVGADDSRLAASPSKVSGLGRGTIRLYADAEGALVGWAKTFQNSSRFFSYDPRFPSDTKRRKAAIGRPTVAQR